MSVSPSLAEVIALLPCPFCGCKPELFRGRNRSRVACTTKRCKVQPVGLSVHPFTKAIAAWNGRRAAPEVGDNRAAFVNGYMECAHRHVMASTPISAIEHHARIAADAAGYDATRTSAASLRDEDARDAARWRAFAGCARVRLLGSAGLITPKENGYAHIGLEMWTHHEAGNEPPDSVRWLTLYADKCIDAATQPAAQERQA